MCVSRKAVRERKRPKDRAHERERKSKRKKKRREGRQSESASRRLRVARSVDRPYGRSIEFINLNSIRRSALPYMPVSSADVNGGGAATAAAITAFGSKSNDGLSSRRHRPIAWLGTMRGCDGGASGTATTTTTVATATAAKEEDEEDEEEEEEKDRDAAPSEVATSKKCEGQLSSFSLKANSCSPCCCCKAAVASRTEMAQEDHSGGPSWDNLPSVILQEIFSYLSHESRIKASQVHKQQQTEKERARERYLFRVFWERSLNAHKTKKEKVSV